MDDLSVLNIYDTFFTSFANIDQDTFYKTIFTSMFMDNMHYKVHYPNIAKQETSITHLSYSEFTMRPMFFIYMIFSTISDGHKTNQKTTEDSED
ncbi:hypothetical protein [Bartonella tamiae]|uniref:Uncharacterized protein n=1 Tax=Bartonella tamiae Th239 TaxID=1094558 RepID=J0R4B6_9HYPH|nr:hypothetical protein [Bartonella tamiae]EJF90484.1 hypothetical protein ME5_00885 [Bartonella tamiae Th239]EJF93572.1 hypothetical protein MEG_00996 [Bartonella tamiae Th307]